MDETFVRLTFEFYVPLASIIGVFFYVQMGTWLQRVLRLEAKWKAIEDEGEYDEEARKGRFEMQFELKEYLNPVFGFLIAIVNLFLLALAILSYMAFDQVEGLDDLFLYFALPYWAFTGLFFLVSLVIVYTGYRRLFAIHKKIYG
ncbi:MAG: hypothetical protein ACXACI_11730 [Candidatus Hodarchaeales archaeon]|jgi:hypothetical protein